MSDYFDSITMSDTSKILVDVADDVAAANKGSTRLVVSTWLASTNSYVLFPLLLFSLLIITYTIGIDVVGFDL